MHATPLNIRKAPLALLLAVSLAPFAAHTALAQADTDDGGDPSIYNVDNATTTLPLLICYYNGGKSYYLATDASDQATAKSFGANYVPQLARVLQDTGNKAFDNIYVVTNNKQYNVLPSSPQPLGPQSTDVDYTPLWQVTQVTWKTTPRILRSETEILDAQAKGELTVTPTDIVVNCPVIFTTFGGRLPQATVTLGTRKDRDRRYER